MRNLVRTQIVDKNGKLTTRWMKEGSYSRSNYVPPPKPVERVDSPLPRGGVREMKEIKASVTARLQEETLEATRGGFNYWHTDIQSKALEVLNEAVAARDYEKVKVYEKHLSIGFSPEHLKELVDHLQSQGYENIAEGLTEEKMEGFVRFSKKLRTSTLGGYPETIKGLTVEERNALATHAGELIFTNEDVEETIYNLVVDQGITEPEKLTAALHESDRISTAFYGGIL